MKPQTCPHEPDVLDLAGLAQWPGRADATLVAHVDRCATCSDVVTVAIAFCEAAELPPSILRLPDPSVVWQRAQWHAREAAARDAARPVLAAQAVAAISLLAVLVAGASWLAGLLPSWSSFGAPALRGWTTVRSAFDSGLAPAVAISSLPDLPAGLIWMAASALAAGLLIVALALGVSKLADSAPDIPARR